MGASRPRKTRALPVAGPAAVAALDHTNGTGAACSTALETFDGIIGQRTPKAVRTKAAGICDACALKTMCAVRVHA